MPRTARISAGSVTMGISSRTLPNGTTRSAARN